MFVEKCKRVMMEERKGRRRARRMAREVSGVMMNPIASVGGFVGGAAESTASLVGAEDMSGGAKVLLLLAVAGAVGGGIYYFTQKPAAAATTPPATNTAAAGTNVGNTPVTIAGNTMTYSQAVALFASINRTTVAALAAGVPAALWDQASPVYQNVLTAMGYRRIA